METDLIIEHWEDSKTYFFAQFPEFVYRQESGFSELSLILKYLPQEKKKPHEKLIKKYDETYKKDRLALEKIAHKIKEGTISLEKINLEE